MVADDQLQFGYEIDHELAERAQRFAEGVTPGRQIGIALGEKAPDKALKSLSERRIRDVALVLIELARGKEASKRDQGLMQFVD